MMGASTVSQHGASGASTARSMDATGTNDSTRLSGTECEEATEQGSGENETLHYRPPWSANSIPASASGSVFGGIAHIAVTSRSFRL
jgi:hypothetical protein